MGHQRERFNAHARTPARPTKRSKREHGADEGVDTNASIVVPKSDEAKEVDRRERLKREVSRATLDLLSVSPNTPWLAPRAIAVQDDLKEEQAS